jgi:predicted site-specific integrase-resolvase
MDTSKDEKYMTPSQAARYTKLTAQYLAKLSRKGKLNPIVGEGGRRTYLYSEISNLVISREKKYQSKVLYIRAHNEEDLDRQLKLTENKKFDTRFEIQNTLLLGKVFKMILTQMAKGEIEELHLPHERSIVWLGYDALKTTIESFGVKVHILGIPISKDEKIAHNRAVYIQHHFPDFVIPEVPDLEDS